MATNPTTTPLDPKVLSANAGAINQGASSTAKEMTGTPASISPTNNGYTADSPFAGSFPKPSTTPALKTTSSMGQGGVQ